jgi:hypothetical protein
MHGDQLQKAVLTALEVAYNEDKENLKKMTEGVTGTPRCPGDRERKAFVTTRQHT